jgi:sarcosine oxidase subunit beta
MRRYSAFAIAREAARHHLGWERAWRSPTPKARYDVVIVGAGGHGLATAYYLGKNHGITNVAVIEKGWLGGGNTGRNTTIIRSNYLQDPSAAIYEKARSLYETLSQDLNYNIMFSPRGVMMLAQTEHEIRGYQRTAHANALQGVTTEFIGPARSRSCARSSTSRARATRSWARCGSRAAARRATTRSPGAMRGPVPTWAWTSSSRPR